MVGLTGSRNNNVLRRGIIRHSMDISLADIFTKGLPDLTTVDIQPRWRVVSNLCEHSVPTHPFNQHEHSHSLQNILVVVYILSSCLSNPALPMEMANFIFWTGYDWSLEAGGLWQRVPPKYLFKPGEYYVA